MYDSPFALTSRGLRKLSTSRGQFLWFFMRNRVIGLVMYGTQLTPLPHNIPKWPLPNPKPKRIACINPHISISSKFTNVQKCPSQAPCAYIKQNFIQSNVYMHNFERFCLYPSWPLVSIINKYDYKSFSWWCNNIYILLKGNVAHLKYKGRTRHHWMNFDGRI